MYAVKKGHVEIVKRLIRCEHMDWTIKNRVSLAVEQCGTFQW